MKEIPLSNRWWRSIVRPINRVVRVYVSDANTAEKDRFKWRFVT